MRCTGIAFEDFSYTTYRFDVQANANWVGVILDNGAGQTILTQAYYLPKYTWGYTRPDGDVIISSTALGNPVYTPASFFTVTNVVDGLVFLTPESNCASQDCAQCGLDCAPVGGINLSS